MRLTQQQHSVLCAVSDWKAHYEIVNALFPRGANLRQSRSVRKTLDTLRDRYLVRFGAANETYKITERGREMLSPARSD